MGTTRSTHVDDDAGATAAARGSVGARNPSLDGIRGLAILMVVSAHATVPFARLGGSTGITLFFALSGYLITTILLAERDGTGRVSFGAFYARRALRLLPALFVAVIGGVALSILLDLHPVEQVLASAALSLFYLTNVFELFGVEGLGVFGYYWSLSLEEQFYLLWPPILLVALGRSRPGSAPSATRWHALVGVVVALAVASAAARLYVAWDPSGWTGQAEALPHTNVFAILLGCAGALWHRYAGWSPSWRSTSACLALVLATTLVAGLRGGLSEPADATSSLIRVAIPLVLVLPCVGLVMGAAAHPQRSRILTHGLLRYFGTVSYGWYLWHGVMIAVTVHVTRSAGAGDIRSGAARSLGVLAALGIAHLSYRFVEEPFLRRKRRYERAPDGREAASS